MVGIVGRALIQSVRILFAFASLWLVLSLSAPLAPSAFAQDASKICTTQTQSCGCATCGCCGGFCDGGGRPSCPPGSHLYNDYCLPDCPAGWSRYPGEPGLCMPPCQHGCPEGYDQVPLPECPENYIRDIRNPDRCVPDYDRVRNYDNCPQGMNWSSETGQCEFDCPDNFYRDDNGRCQFAYDKECRQGYTRDLRTGKCMPEGDWPVTYRWVCLPACPQGTYRDIRYPTRCVPPPPVCDEGYELRGGRCLPVCEPGTRQDRYGYCVPQTCPDGQYPDIRGRCRDPECPNGLKRGDDGNCSPPDDVCPQGQISIRGECTTPCGTDEERNEDGRCVPVDEGCPQGQEEVNGQCTPICKQGLKRDARGNCVPERQGCARGTVPFKGTCVEICQKDERRNADGRCVTVEKRCPEGFLRTKSGACIRIPTEVICGKGMRPDGQGGCVRVVPLLPRVCPERTFYNKATKSCEPIRRPRPKPQDTGDNGDDSADDGPDSPPPIRRLNLQPQITPEMLQQLIPRKKPRGANIQEACPKGFFRDSNGRCVEG